jgi:hypothetical protein
MSLMPCWRALVLSVVVAACSREPDGSGQPVAVARQTPTAPAAEDRVGASPPSDAASEEGVRSSAAALDAGATPAAGPCDERPLLEAARLVQTCAADRDCSLTDFGDCAQGGQACGALPHRHDADLTGYREARANFLNVCDERVRCRCARPRAAVCRAGRCEAAP